jgi:hypothetical protein
VTCSAQRRLLSNRCESIGFCAYPLDVDRRFAIMLLGESDVI